MVSLPWTILKRNLCPAAQLRAGRRLHQQLVRIPTKMGKFGKRHSSVSLPILTRVSRRDGRELWRVRAFVLFATKM